MGGFLLYLLYQTVESFYGQKALIYLKGNLSAFFFCIYPTIRV